MEIIQEWGFVFLTMAVIFGLYMTWGIGANDVANAMGTSVGSGAITVKQAIIIAAGLSGVRSKADPGPRHDIDMYAEGHTVKGAPKLPLNMLDALRAYDEDEGLKAAMGEAFSSSYVKMKRQEWNDYCSHLSSWEKANTLDI